jgi:hypothetical protein
MNIFTIAATVALTGALVSTGSIAASAEEAPVEVAQECNFGEHLARLWLHLPAELRGDLKDLGSLEAGERGPAVRDIRDAARDGEYGDRVEERAERVAERRIRILANMPTELREDLKQLRAADAEDRRGIAEEIAANALAGDYGPKAQSTAERIRDSRAWQNCTIG